MGVFSAIARLKKEKNAIILAHYYQDPDIQDIADVIGDSLELARAAQKTQASIILFAGVHFMAEGAKILNPHCRVIIPDLKAGCSLASGCQPDAFRRFRARYPDHFVVSYINCSAAIKAQSDIICTSSNAVTIVNKIPRDRKIIFAPDKNLGAYVSRQTGRDMVLWQGTCIVHETFSLKKLIALKVMHPEALVLAHPECEPDILTHADIIGSTSHLLRTTVQHSAQTFIIATEPGIIHQMQKNAPHKTFIPLPGLDESCACNECPYMRLNTLEKIEQALRIGGPEITLPEDLRLQAQVALDKMLAWS